MPDKSFVDFMEEELPIEGNPIPNTEAKKRFFCGAGDWKEVQEPGLDCQIPEDIREEIMRGAPKRPS